MGRRRLIPAGSRLLTSLLALVSCFSVCLLVHNQLNQDELQQQLLQQQQQTTTITNGKQLATSRHFREEIINTVDGDDEEDEGDTSASGGQHRRRYLLMTGILGDDYHNKQQQQHRQMIFSTSSSHQTNQQDSNFNFINEDDEVDDEHQQPSQHQNLMRDQDDFIQFQNNNNESNNSLSMPSLSSASTSAIWKRQLPRLLIIGVRKGGTRALLEMLNLHPNIAMVPVEVHFFDKIENYERGLDWYRQQMPPSLQGQLTVEKSPSYYVTPEVPERVWAMDPHIQLVLIVRDPVTRLLSDFAQIEASRAAQGLAQRRFQDVALLPNGEVNTQNRALHVSLYAKFLSRWLHVFPRRQLHIVDGDELIKDPWPELQKVETFLGLEHKIRRDQLYFNATKGFYCLTDVVSIVPNNNSSGSTNNSTMASTTVTSQQDEKNSQESVHYHHHHHKCLAGSKGRRHPQVPDEVISVLRQFFAPHNRKFFAMVGQDFNWPDQ